MNVTWQDDTNYNVYYSKLDPSLDNQDGSAADENAISVVDDTVVAGGDTDSNYKANMSWVSVSGDNALVTYHDWYTETYNLKVYGPSGDETLSKTISDADKWGTFGYHSYGYSTSDRNGGVHFVWVDDSDGDDEIYYTQLASGGANEYYFPWYDCQGMKSWLHITNPGSAPTLASVYIAGVLKETQTVAAGADLYLYYSGLMNGPVTILSSAPVLASQRSLYGTSFCEVKATASSEAASTVYLPWYDCQAMNTWVLVTNPQDTLANVKIYVAGTLREIKPVLPGQTYATIYPGVMGGPVKVTSTGASVIASQRSIYATSFAEVPGISTLASTNHFPWYDNTLMASWVLVGNPTGGAVDTTVSVDGTPLGTASVPAGGTKYFQFSGVVGGPVKVESSDDVFATERSLFGPSFCEVVGTGSPSTTSYFPWYDGIYMKTWVLVSNPSAADTATIDLDIGTTKKVDDYDILPGKTAYFIYPGLMNGPAKVTSNKPVITSQRSLYPPVGSTSFWELGGIAP